jgi:hypothetical protein
MTGTTGTAALSAQVKASYGKPKPKKGTKPKKR